MSSYEEIAELPLKIEGYELEGLEHEAPGFTRLSTVIHLKGDGEEGVGEDVVYDALDHVAQQDRGPTLELAGEHTIDSFSKLIEGLDLFPTAPERDVSVNYRRWAFESAALDLALRQAGTSLHEQLGREPRPVNFVVSMRLGSMPREGEEPEPSSIEPVRERLAVYPDLRFKLDPTNDWTDELIQQLVETGAVDSLDLKGQYKGTPVDVDTDPELYGKLIEAFPEAWLEDPDVTDETKPILDEVADRVTWDAPIHSVADIEDRPWPPKMVNIKPSRFGPLRELFKAYDHCHDRNIGAYGGGQWELGPGRGHIQYLASIFHPDTPNDVAPSGYNTDGTKPGYPTSPLEPQPTKTGFRWDG
jgi:L-alanine-DL-glutamate epimerase-like enolase superfamily enzyme